MTDLPVGEDLKRFLDGQGSAVEGALLVARIIDDDAEVEWARDEIARLAETIDGFDASDASDNSDASDAILSRLRAEGFAGVAGQFEIKNSSLDWVLRNRRGIPISLAVVVMGVAQALGRESMGVNFPQHFLVSVDTTLIDPFRLEATTEAQCRAWLKQNSIRAGNAFQNANSSDIVLRMLNNIRMLAVGRHDYSRALEFSDYQLLIVPNAYGLYVDRAEIWMAMGAADMVAHELQTAIDLAADEAVRSRLRARLRLIGRTPTTLN